jgi:RNAse (barnase) inhibitor barstar
VTSSLSTITIDCAQVRTREDFWSAYLTAVKPQDADLFGRNLDALWDALAGGPGSPGECVLRLVGARALEAIDDGNFLRALKEIARDSRTVQVIVE